MHPGKEIYLFFSIYGINGIIGILISQSLIGVIVYKVLKIAMDNKINNYDKLMQNINSNKKINEIIKIIVDIFLLLSFYVMIAGFSAYFSQELGLPNIIGAVAIIILCYAVFMGDIEGLVKVNIIVIPILIGFIILLITKNLNVFQNINEKIIQNSQVKSIWSSILYASYNSITLIPIIISLKKYIKNKKEIIAVSIITIIILTIIAIAIYGLILKVDIDINKLELPTVYVAGMSGKLYKYAYGGIILIAIFTSAIAAGYSLLEKHKEMPRKYKKIAMLLCGSAILTSKIGFSNLINTLYPVFGLLGIIQIYSILKK